MNVQAVTRSANAASRNSLFALVTSQEGQISIRYRLFQAKDLELLIAGNIDVSVGHYRN
jgi:hypothetical protein